ncbi:FtsH protease activity modulator HflK [Methylomarinum vadi]|uniref:FtsH protease activity modulator HflK n=1 Tax=Methylomarinum vadi TaxID=438855 RepID=UPI0004DFC4C7|nr:FtsH protease activity modulator HflK [Methylomarinum vadi]
MSWNEPGGDNKDPWSGRNDKNGPPDLDEAIRSLQEKLGGIFGGGTGGGSGGGSSLKSFGFLLVGALVLWGLSGFYIVDEGTRGVVTRFGAYTDTTQAGLNWHIPVPIEQVQIINVEQQRFIEVGYRSGGRQGMGSVPREALMLTKDENIVDVRLAVQYQVKDAKDYAFNVLNPAATLKQVTESVERGVVGNNNMDFVLTEGRSEVVSQIKQEIQTVMDSYKAGVLITSVNLQDAQPPEQVQGAFEDAIKAREDKQRLINEAEAYSNDVVPKARGAASRLTQEAEAYKERLIAQASGEASRFSQLLKEYKRAPKVTRERLYLESMEEVLTNTATVMVDVKGGNNLFYLPLDKMTKQQTGTSEAAEAQAPVTLTPQQTRIVNNNLRTSSRGRDVRGR